MNFVLKLLLAMLPTPSRPVHVFSRVIQVCKEEAIRINDTCSHNSKLKMRYKVKALGSLVNGVDAGHLCAMLKVHPLLVSISKSILQKHRMKALDKFVNKKLPMHIGWLSWLAHTFFGVGEDTSLGMCLCNI